MTFSGNMADPMARLMLTMLAGFATFERDLIRERQREGIMLAKARGAYKILSFLSSGFFGELEEFVAIEILVVFEHAPDGVQQFAHHRDHGLHWSFTGGDELAVKRLHVGLMLNGHQCGHVKLGAQVAVADFADPSRAMDRAARFVRSGIEPGMRHPLRC